METPVAVVDRVTKNDFSVMDIEWEETEKASYIALHTTRHMCGRRIRFSVFYLVSQSVSQMGYDALLPPDSPLLPFLRQLLIEKAPPSLSVCLSLPPSSIPGYGTHSSNQHKSRLPPILLAHLLRQNCWRRYVVRSVPSSPQQESQNLWIWEVRHMGKGRSELPSIGIG